jgi:hypothetical protein
LDGRDESHAASTQGTPEPTALRHRPLSSAAAALSINQIQLSLVDSPAAAAAAASSASSSSAAAASSSSSASAAVPANRSAEVTLGSPPQLPSHVTSSQMSDDRENAGATPGSSAGSKGALQPPPLPPRTTFHHRYSTERKRPFESPQSAPRLKVQCDDESALSAVQLLIATFVLLAYLTLVQLTCSAPTALIGALLLLTSARSHALHARDEQILGSASSSPHSSDD